MYFENQCYKMQRNKNRLKLQTLEFLMQIFETINFVVHIDNRYVQIKMTCEKQ